MSEEMISRLVRPDVAKMKAYFSARTEMAYAEDLVWLDANENPWPPSSEKDDTGGVRSCNRYPDPQPPRLVQKAAERYGVKAENIIVSRGTDEAIDLLIRAFCRAGQDSILQCPPAFPMYAWSAELQGAKVVNAPLDAKRGYALDADAVIREASQPEHSVKLVFLCNPNNPTGNHLSPQDMLRVCKELENKCLVVIDEAYIEFSEQGSLIPKIAEHPNLVILRTLSKALALAGARCGFAISQPALIDVLKKVIAPYPIPLPVTRIVEENLQPENAHLASEHVAALIKERKRLEQELPKCPDVVKIYPSDANFLFIETKDAKAFLKRLLDANIVVRDRSKVSPNCVRLTVGTPQQNNRVLAALGLEQGIEGEPSSSRKAHVSRDTKETKIRLRVNLDEPEEINAHTGIGFFDHMLEQLAKHGGFSLSLWCEGDLEVDAHHTVEDCALVLGQALKQALGDKKGLSRYGFLLPMDESLAQVAIDLSGRPNFCFEGKFKESLVGQFPTEMTPHFFKSLANSLGASLHIKVSGENAHHMAEACFKAVGRALRMAFKKEGNALPSTKGVL
ncbi:MAG: histidinol-phosphate transaminase [bacterium]